MSRSGSFNHIITSVQLVTELKIYKYTSLIASRAIQFRSDRKSYNKRFVAFRRTFWRTLVSFFSFFFFPGSINCIRLSSNLSQVSFRKFKLVLREGTGAKYRPSLSRRETVSFEKHQMSPSAREVRPNRIESSDAREVRERTWRCYASDPARFPA